MRDLRIMIFVALCGALVVGSFVSPSFADALADRLLEMEARLEQLEKSMEALNAKPHLEISDGAFPLLSKSWSGKKLR
jgi:outer membrane murein-binding lipoprotein Lpp